MSMTPTGVRSTMRTTSVPGGIVSVEYVSMSGNRASAACTSPESMSGSGVPMHVGERRLHLGGGDALRALDAHVAQRHERRVRADPDHGDERERAHRRRPPT